MKRILLVCAVLLTFLAMPTRAADLQLNWTQATKREDGTAITGLKQYHIKYSIDNVEQTQIDLDGTLDSYTMSDIGAGTYTFSIATSENGLKGAYSNTVTKVIGEKDAALPETVTFTVDLTNCTEPDCVLEVK